MDASNRPAIIVYGNCQAEFLGLLLKNTLSIADRFDIAVASNNIEAGPAPAPLASQLHRAVLLWEQYDQRATVELRDDVRAGVPRGCPVVRYPAIGMDTFWPFFVRDPRNRPEPGFPFGRYPLGDRVAAQVAEMGVGPEQAYELYMQLSAEKMPDLESLVSRVRWILERRDAECDVSMSSFLFANLRSQYQFWTRTHLTILVMGELLEQLLARSTGTLGPVTGGLRRELDAVYARFPGQGEFQQPIHPIVIERLGLTFVNNDTRYPWFGQSWTFREYMTRYIAFDRTW